MPRNYKRKTEDRYSKEVLNKALARIKNGDSVYSVSRTMNIPEQTLRNRLKRKTEDSVKGAGRKPLIPEEIENDLAENIVLLSDSQQPLTRGEIISIVQEYFEVNQLKNPFSKTNKSPGREWFDGFMRRHPQIVKRKAQAIQKSRVQCATKESFTKFFTMFKATVEKLGIKNPGQIVNLDETGYASSTATRVLAKKGTKCVSQVQGGSGKEMFSVVETVAADGHLFPPLIIYKSKNLYDSWCVNGPEGAAYLSSPHGWQDKKTFLCYFQKFVEWTKDMPKPILVIYDGHKSHTQYRVAKLAIENNIQILTLPAHSSDKIQPLDVGVFAPVKKMWLTIKREHGRKTSFKTIRKEDFPNLMKELRDRGAFKEASIKAGFKSSGVWPIDLQRALKKLPPAPETRPNLPKDNENNPALVPVSTQTEDELIGNQPDDAIHDRLSSPLADNPAVFAENDGLPDETSTQADQIQTQDVNHDAILLPLPEDTISNHPNDELVKTINQAEDELAKNTTPRSKHDLSNFRDILLKTITPRQDRNPAKKKKLSFNNVALTEKDVIQQMKSYEKEVSEREKKKEERKLLKKIKQEAKNQENGKKGATLKRKNKPLKKKIIKNKIKKGKSVSQWSSSSEEESEESFVSDCTADNLESFLSSSDEFEAEDAKPNLKSFDEGVPGPSGLQNYHMEPEPKRGDYVAAIYENEWYLTTVISISKMPPPINAQYFHLKFTEIKGENKFQWPSKEDEIPIIREDILCVVPPPIPVSSRHIGLDKDAYKKVKKLFVKYLTETK